MAQGKFRREVVKELIKSTTVVPAVRRGRRPTASHNLTRLIGRHFLRKIVPTGKKARISRACAVCSVADKQVCLTQDPPITKKRYGRESTYECSQCEKALCVAPCHELYHTYSDFVTAFKRLNGNLQNESSCDTD